MTQSELSALINEVSQRIEMMRNEAGRIPSRTGDIEAAEAYLEKLYNTIAEDDRVADMRKELTETEKGLQKAIEECRLQTEKYQTESKRLGDALKNARDELDILKQEQDICQKNVQNEKKRHESLVRDVESQLQNIKNLEQRMEEDKKVLEELSKARLELTQARQEADKAVNEALLMKQEKQRLETELEVQKRKTIEELEVERKKLEQREAILNQGMVNLEKKEKILDIKKQKLIQYKNECEVFYNRLFKDLII